MKAILLSLPHQVSQPGRLEPSLPCPCDWWKIVTWSDENQSELRMTVNNTLFPTRASEETASPELRMSIRGLRMEVPQGKLESGDGERHTLNPWIAASQGRIHA